MSDAAIPEHPAVIAGKQVPTDRWIDVLDPSDARTVARVARCGPAEVGAAVEAARHTHETVWRFTTPQERSRVCRRIAEILSARREELAALETLDTGKPLRQSLADADVAARYFDFYANAVEGLGGETIQQRPDRPAFTLREPYGVCGHIIPWNYPLQIAARTLAPALAAGNCCVLKPAEDAPLTSLRLAAIAEEAGLPAGALNVVPGLGAEAGAALAAHPGLDRLAFTGSREVGEAVMTAAARTIVPVTLELGGKSPHLVLPDYDAARAVPQIVESITEHAGQNCSAGSRLLVHRSVHGELVDALVERFRALTIGPGRTDPDMGPLISAKQRARVLGHLARGRRDAVLRTGGGVPEGKAYADGFYVEPTVLDEVTPEHRVFNEEIFGPVLCVSVFDSLEEAVALAEHTTYGLAAGVWTSDVTRAHWLAQRLRVGQVFVNNYSAAGGVELPFGGYRRSGIGVEKGLEALREYTRCKTVAIHAQLPS
ncbi:aldehyde dehydrogenase family protein [Streptomyces sp. NPDC002667]|uniref:aldehyde dehydrogenase family protein n=1 Tax=Streptomyces sp. NPDC002667 TaxID=3364657 RepID=UPI00368AC1E2